MMENPLVKQIEELNSKVISGVKHNGQVLITLDDAIEALQQLEKDLWTICQHEVDRLTRQDEISFH